MSENLPSSRITVSLGLPRVCDRAHLTQRIGVFGTGILELSRGDGVRATLALPGSLVRAMASLVFSRFLYEWPAPRPATLAELGIAAVCTAEIARTRYGLPDVTVDVPMLGAAEWVRALDEHASALLVPVEVVLDGTSHLAHLIVDQSAASAPAVPARTAADLMRERGARLSRARMRLSLVTARARLSASQIRALAPRDIVLLAQPAESGHLRLGRGRIPVSVDLGAARVTVSGPYQRGIDMNELLFDDAMVDVTCRVGRVSLSAREVLELEPGHVLALDTPVSGPFDLMCGDMLIGRAELVDIEGQVGVRILALADSLSTGTR